MGDTSHFAWCGKQLFVVGGYVWGGYNGVAYSLFQVVKGHNGRHVPMLDRLIGSCLLWTIIYEMIPQCNSFLNLRLRGHQGRYMPRFAWWIIDSIRCGRPPMGGYILTNMFPPSGYGKLL